MTTILKNSNSDLIEGIYQSLMNNPDFALRPIPASVISKEAMDIARSQARQVDNTRTALSLSADFQKELTSSPVMATTPPAAAAPLTLEDSDDEQLQESYNSSSEAAKDWDKRGYRDIANMYRRKMYDVDAERDRRADVTRQIFNPGGKDATN